MFAAVAVVALIAAEAVAFPGWVAFVVGIFGTSFFPPTLVAGIVYSRGYKRAFCIGALAWLMSARWIAGISIGAEKGYLSTYDLLWNANDSDWDALGHQFRLNYCIAWALSLAGGFVAIAVRWLTLDQSSREPQ